jgi:hypothetical protein
MDASYSRDRSNIRDVRNNWLNYNRIHTTSKIPDNSGERQRKRKTKKEKDSYTDATTMMKVTARMLGNDCKHKGMSAKAGTTTEQRNGNSRV